MDKGKAMYDQATDALCHCRLEIARNLFAEAAGHYAQGAKVDRNNVDLNKLNAAICSYLAGYYDEAIGIIESIRTGKLEKTLSQMSSDLYEESRKRRRMSYWETVSGDLVAMRELGLHKDILGLLKNNPYCLKSSAFARQMRDSCDALGMQEIAILFQKDVSALDDYD